MKIYLYIKKKLSEINVSLSVFLKEFKESVFLKEYAGMLLHNYLGPAIENLQSP